MCKWILRYQVEICTLRISIIFCKWNWSEHPVWHYDVHRSSLNSFYVLVYRCPLDIALNTHLGFFITDVQMITLTLLFCCCYYIDTCTIIWLLTPCRKLLSWYCLLQQFWFCDQRYMITCTLTCFCCCFVDIQIPIRLYDSLQTVAFSILPITNI